MHALWRAGGAAWRQTLCLAAVAPAGQLQPQLQPHMVAAEGLVSLLQFCNITTTSCHHRLRSGQSHPGQPAAPLHPCRLGSDRGGKSTDQWLPGCLSQLIASHHQQRDGTISSQQYVQRGGFATKVKTVQAVPVMAASGHHPPDVISRALHKGSSEFPFAAKAYYLGSKIDVAALREWAVQDEFPVHFHKSAKGNESTIICLRKGLKITETQFATGLPLATYMMAFSYGSVVVFNASSELLIKALLKRCRKFTKQLQPDEFSEEMMIRIRPAQETWSIHSPEQIFLKRLDWSNMRVVSTVLAQSVALDFYARNVEGMLEKFVDMNMEMHKTGSLSASISKEELLRLVSQNNLILTDIISKLGLLDYYDVAWKTSQYGRIWEYLRRDFDVEARFEIIEDKLTLVQENLKYYLELLQHQKSDTLEWTIIILIAAEIVISLYEMAHRAMT